MLNLIGGPRAETVRKENEGQKPTSRYSPEKECWV